MMVHRDSSTVRPTGVRLGVSPPCILILHPSELAALRPLKRILEEGDCLFDNLQITKFSNVRVLR